MSNHVRSGIDNKSHVLPKVGFHLLVQENLIEDPQIGSARPHGDWMGKFWEINPENAALWQFLVLPELRC
jgi:hypothetical protein